jgi:hypothetical protein
VTLWLFSVRSAWDWRLDGAPRAGLIQRNQTAAQARSGDVVCVFSNGRFGGIHQKLLDALIDFWGRSETIICVLFRSAHWRLEHAVKSPRCFPLFALVEPQ